MSKHIHTMVLIALFAAIICVLAPLSIPIEPVPISVATLAVMLAAYVLGWKNGTISIIIYILLGLVGVPVFAKYTAGISVLGGPTGGYIIGYIPLGIITGLFSEKFRGNVVMPVVGMVLGTIVLYAIGTAWLSLQLDMTFMAGLSAGVIPFIPGDAAKIVVVAVLGPVLYLALVRAGQIPAREKA